MASIKENLEMVRDRIAIAARRAGRDPDLVKLVAVSKKVSAGRIQEAIDAGQELFGENYIQESMDKIPKLPAVSWHFIGHLQSNKAKNVPGLFSVIESLDRLKLAEVLDKNLAGAGRTLAVLVQVNIGGELQKSGILPRNVEAFLRQIKDFRTLKIRGLMAMPPYLADPEAVRPYFREMRILAEKLQGKGLLGDQGVDLSMGMSGDFEVAIEEGATLVRVGTAIFGSRS